MKFDFPFMIVAFFEILKALPLTLVISIVPLLIGFVIGLAVTAIRLCKVKVIHRIAAFYVSFLRGTPMLLHIFIIYFGLPMLIDALSAKYGWKFHSSSIPILCFVLIAFSLTAGAYMSEAIRSGILSVNQGQIDAAYSVGMQTSQAMRRIVFPQALAASLPNLCSMFVGFLHASSLAFSVSLMEINGKASVVASTNWKFLEAYAAAALIYWGLTGIAEKLTRMLEKRISLYNKGGVA
jgi:L-cystine transport system permease protein